MPEYTTQDLKNQFAFINKSGWIEFFKKSAIKHGLRVEVLIAIASRETNINPKFQRVPGDGGHGFSIMQIDIGSFPTFCKSQDWHDPEKAIDMGAYVLREKLNEVGRIANIPTVDHTRIAIAGYNCGVRKAADHYLNRRSPDTGTTEHNYSADTLERAAFFAELLEA